MAKKNKKRLSVGKIVFIITAALVSFSVLIANLIQGKNVALFNPQGYIANEQYKLMIYVIAVLLCVVIPVVFVAYSIAWKYRDTNTKKPTVSKKQNVKLHVLGMWAIPVVVSVFIVSAMWPATHKLAPQSAIAGDAPPLKIQVIALRWKWLFIYPEQGIATVNFVQIPVNTPIVFEMTADETPMSSFWIPNLGGQLYVMTSHVNRLNLMADTAGDYPGSTPEINGIGFAGMKFTARVSNDDEFLKWVQTARQSGYDLDSEDYQKLLQPSENNPVQLFASYKSDLYDKVLMKYNGPTERHEQH